MNLLLENSNINIITAYLIIMIIFYLISVLATATKKEEYGNDLERYIECIIISIFWFPLVLLASIFIVIYSLGMFFDSFMGG